MSAGRIRSIASAAVIVALVWVGWVPATPAASLASWGGRVFSPDRTSPREGVVVRLVQDGGDARWTAEPTREDGAFTITNAPAGTYSLEVETPEGVFVSPQAVALQPGPNTPMALELRPGQLNAKRDSGFGGEGVSRRTEYIFAGVVALVALLVYLKVTEDETETPGSVF